MFISRCGLYKGLLSHSLGNLLFKFVLFTRMPRKVSSPVLFNPVVECQEYYQSNFCISKILFMVVSVFNFSLKLFLPFSWFFAHVRRPKAALCRVFHQSQMQLPNQWMNRTFIQLSASSVSRRLSCSCLGFICIKSCYPFR